jgi:hypothetical protein
MGWQDAPVASPTGPKPAWASAPTATQSHAPAGGVVPEDPRADGQYFGGDGLLSRIGNFINRADRISGRAMHGVTSGLERTGQAAANAVGLDGVGDYLGRDAAQEEQWSSAPVAGETDWQTVKAHPTVGNIGNYIGESAAGALPALGAAAVSLPLFIGSRVGDIAHRRAVNNRQITLSDLVVGKDAPHDVAPTISDLLSAAPSAAVDAVLMRGGLNSMLEGSIGKAAVREGLAQGGMPVADYAGETVGTNVGFNPMEAADRAGAGLVAGVPLGAAGGLVARMRRAPQPVAEAPENLTEGTLNDGPQPAWSQAPVEDILRSVGSDPAHFSTPTRAAAAAERVAKVRPEPAGNLPQDIVSFFRAKGYNDHTARGIAAGIAAEAHGGDHTAVNPTSGALGLGQWLGARKQAIIDRYGPNPTRQEQLEFLHSELQGGDPGGHFVLRAKSDREALDAYIRKFMRPAAGKETDGDLSRGTAALGEKSEPVYRAPPPTDDPFRSESGFERTDRPEEPLSREGAGESRTATGDSSRPFMESTDDPEGHPGFWERRADMQAEELRKEWEASRQEPPHASEDPSTKYGANNYGQRPHMPEGSDRFATTADGHIADVNGKPVAFRNVKDAAKFAAKNKLGGDFEPKVWAANSARVVLSQRPGSTYGERSARPTGPAEPPAGRSPDEAQRLIPEWQKAPQEPAGASPAHETGTEAVGQPKPAGDAVRVSDGLPRAERGSPIDPNVSHGTENVPAGPERFDEAPAPRETDYFPGGTFERPRPEPISGREPPKPRNFARAVIDHLGERTKQTGLNHRLDAEDAISNGVAADQIYHDAKAKFPTIKVQYQRLFATNKGPLKSRAKQTKTLSLDQIGDRFDRDAFGHSGQGRLEPHEIGQLLHESINGHESAFDQHDPRYTEYNDWVARHDAAQEFEARYGDRWHEMTDEELDRIDAAENPPIDDMLDHVLGEHAPEEHDGRPFSTEEPAARPTGEDAPGEGRSERDAGEAGGREPAAEDALIAPRESDQRDTLQRRADAGLKPDAEQKSAGSDGGLFDTRDTTGDMLEFPSDPAANHFRRFVDKMDSLAPPKFGDEPKPSEAAYRQGPAERRRWLAQRRRYPRCAVREGRRPNRDTS